METNGKASLQGILLADKKRTVIIMISVLLLSVLAPLKSFIMQWLIDSGSKAEALQNLGYGIGVVLLGHFFEYISRDAFAKTATRAIADVRDRLTDNLARTSLHTYTQEGGDGWFSAMTNELRIISDDYYTGLFNIVFWGGMGLVAIIYMALISPVLLVISLLLCVLPFVPPKVLGPRLSKAKERFSGSTMRYYNAANEGVHGYETVLFNNSRAYLRSRLHAASQENIENDYKTRLLTNGSLIVTSLIAWIPSFIVLVAGAFLVFDGKITIGFLVTANSLVNFILSPFRSVANAYTTVKSTASMRKKIEALLNSEAMQEQKQTITKVEHIAIQNVHFTYPKTENEILKGIHMNIRNGDKVAIVGASGCGKSTLLRLLCKHYESFDGEILINGSSIKSIDDDSYFGSITYIPQEPFIFEDTVRNNISLGKEYPEEKIKEVIALSGLEDVISSLENGLDTVLSEHGGNISGGQKKRIAIARALIRGCDTLLIDEVTSSLDVETTSSLVQWLLTLPCTIVVVTHDIFDSYMNRFTTIYCMEGGKIAESGTYDDLIRQQGVLTRFREAINRREG